MLYCRLRVCGECGCNYECQCDCCFNMKQSVKRERVLCCTAGYVSVVSVAVIMSVNFAVVMT